MLYRRSRSFSALERGSPSGDRRACWRFHGRRTSRQPRRDGRYRAAAPRGAAALARPSSLTYQTLLLASNNAGCRPRRERSRPEYAASRSADLVSRGTSSLGKSETVERNDGVVGEAPTAFGGGGFVSATSSIFIRSYRAACELGDLRRSSSPISRFTFLSLTTYPAALQRFTRAIAI